jgi:hypothetical protein
VGAQGRTAMAERIGFSPAWRCACGASSGTSFFTGCQEMSEKAAIGAFSRIKRALALRPEAERRRPGGVGLGARGGVGPRGTGAR